MLEMLEMYTREVDELTVRLASLKAYLKSASEDGVDFNESFEEWCERQEEYYAQQGEEEYYAHLMGH